MNGTLAIFRREFLGYFRAPVAYVFLIVFVIATVALTWFLGSLFDNGEASLTIMFSLLPWILLFMVPAVGMRLWAEEKRAGTWELLFTLPIDVPGAVLGKYLAGLAFLAIALASTFTLALTVSFLGDPDWGPIASGYFGSLLLAGSYLGVCSLASTLSRSQVISFVISVMFLFLVFMLGVDQFSSLLFSIGTPTWLVDMLASTSFTTHYIPMTRGLISLGDVFYFVGTTVVTLVLTVVALQR